MTCRNCGRRLQVRNIYGYCASRTPERAECRKLYETERYRQKAEQIKENYREYRRANLDRELERGRRYKLAHPETAAEYRRHTSAWWRDVVNTYKVQQGCENPGCGFRSDRAGYFDLDHVDPSTKSAEISLLCSRLMPGNPEHKELFFAEMKKCQVLCVACHRDKTAADHRQRNAA